MFGLVAASFGSDRVDAKAPPRDAQIYSKLYAKAQANPDVVAGRNVLKNGRAKDGKLVWKIVRQESVRMRRDLRISYLDRNPSQWNNYELAGLLYPGKRWAFDVIIGGGDGPGGNFGESDWHHDIWNGGHRGAWPDRTSGGTTSAVCNFGDAYGLGQACERYKMEHFAGTKRVYESPKLQLQWMVYYATNHPGMGSIEAAAHYWQRNKHW